MEYDCKFYEFLGTIIDSNNEKINELLNDENVKKQDKILTEYEMMMLSIFRKTFADATIICDRVLDLNAAREVYNSIKRECYTCSDAELEEKFFDLYEKMTETKSVAEQWYEAEERSYEIAIATLNKLAEKNKTKIK